MDKSERKSKRRDGAVRRISAYGSIIVLVNCILLVCWVMITCIIQVLQCESKNPVMVVFSLCITLFNYIADLLHRLLTECNLLNTDVPLKLGFTFSFPVKQTALNKAYLANWTKHYRCSDLIGKDVGHTLEEAIRQRGDMNIQCTAIINDTIGTLVSGAFIDANCCIGLICGTGTNGSCFEPMKNFKAYKNGTVQNGGEVALDTKWNSFGLGDVLDFMKSEFDHDIAKDTEAVNMGIEKLMSGLFIGENVRRVLMKMYKEKIALTSWAEWPTQWNSVHSLDTSFVSNILCNDVSDKTNVNNQLRKLDIDTLPLDDCRLIYRICELVVFRAGCLGAACTACLVQRIGRPVVGVAVDGTVFRRIELFRKIMEEKTSALAGLGQKVYFVLCNDGSGLGAALVAAMVDRAQRRTVCN